MIKTPKIVITGMGMVTPLAHDTAGTWQALLNQKSGIEQIQSFDASQFPTQIAAEVKHFVAGNVIRDKKLLRQTVPFTQFALAAASEALQDAKTLPNAATAERWGIVTGAGMMSAEFAYWSRFQQHFAPEGQVEFSSLSDIKREFLSLADFAKTQANSGLALLAQQFGIRGYANSVHTACASGGQAIGLALQVMRRGDADYMLVGGFDSMINPIGLSSFCLLGALSTYNDAPQTASRPFDLNRNGFVLGEGAAFLILEKYESAKARGAKIYAELAGEGNSMSSYRITDSHPSGDGAIQALMGALNDANLSIDDVEYINAHGTSTKMNDLCESNAIHAVFKQHVPTILVSSTKSQTGHLIAAAGALEAAFSCLAIYHGQLPMNMNYTTPDPDCALNIIADAPREQRVRSVLSNSFGFGGSNSCLAFKAIT